MSVVVLVLGAGRGSRLGADIPKANVLVAGRSLLHWSATALGAAECVDAVLPVVAPESDAVVDALRETWTGPAQLLDAVLGGPTRQASLACGLEAISRQCPAAAWVLVHDAARCLVEPQDAEIVLAAARETGAALPGLAVSDTLKQVSAGDVVRTIDRGQVVRALTPQGFRLSLLAEALEKALQSGFKGTDSASLVERLGVTVRLCQGREGNFKVTGPADLERAAALLAGRGAGT